MPLKAIILPDQTPRCWVRLPILTESSDNAVAQWPSCALFEWILIVKDHAEQAAVYRQPVAVVIDESKSFELVHESTDLRPRGADHLCQCLLGYAWDHVFGSAFLPKMRKLQENPSQTLLARVEKLVDEIRFISEIS